MTQDLRDALVSELGKALEASGHPYSYYNIQTAADVAMDMYKRWSAKEPAAPKQAASKPIASPVKTKSTK